MLRSSLLLIMAMIHGGFSGEGSFNFSIMMHGTQDHRKPTNNDNCSHYCLFMGHTVFSVYHSLRLTEGDDVLWKLRGLQSVSHSEKSPPAQLKRTKIVPSFTAAAFYLTPFKFMTYFTF